MALSAAQHAGLVTSVIMGAEVPSLETGLTADGHLRILPSMWAENGGLDGFFIARFAKPNV